MEEIVIVYSYFGAKLRGIDRNGTVKIDFDTRINRTLDFASMLEVTIIGPQEEYLFDWEITDVERDSIIITLLFESPS